MSSNRGRLAGKRTLIVGANRGIGASIARGFAIEGAAVACAARRSEAAAEAAAELREAGHEAYPVVLDLRERSLVEAGVDEAVSQMGHIDVLVQNGAMTATTPFIDIEPTEWREVLATNLDGTFHACQLVARHLRGRDARGSIIAVSSQLSQVAIPNKAHYLASKGGIAMLTKAMALELAPAGIRVNALAPGVTKTDMAMSRLSVDDEAMARTLQHIPMGRLAEPDEMSGAAIFLASDESSYVSGITLFVDGGYLTC